MHRLNNFKVLSTLRNIIIIEDYILFYAVLQYFIINIYNLYGFFLSKLYRADLRQPVSYYFARNSETNVPPVIRYPSSDFTSSNVTSCSGLHPSPTVAVTVTTPSVSFEIFIEL